MQYVVFNATHVLIDVFQTFNLTDKNADKGYLSPNQFEWEEVELNNVRLKDTMLDMKQLHSYSGIVLPNGVNQWAPGAPITSMNLL